MASPTRIHSWCHPCEQSSCNMQVRGPDTPDVREQEIREAQLYPGRQHRSRQRRTPEGFSQELRPGEPSRSLDSDITDSSKQRGANEGYPHRLEQYDDAIPSRARARPNYAAQSLFATSPDLTDLVGCSTFLAAAIISERSKKSAAAITGASLCRKFNLLFHKIAWSMSKGDVPAFHTACVYKGCTSLSYFLWSNEEVLLFTPLPSWSWVPALIWNYVI